MAMWRQLGADGRDHVLEVARLGDERTVGGKIGADRRSAGFDAGPHNYADFVV